MHNRHPCPQAHPVELHRNRVRGKAKPFHPGFGQIVQLGIKNQIGDIADHPVVLEVVERFNRRMACQIAARSGKVQLVIGQLLHGQPAGGGAGYGNRHIGLALGQVHHARQGDNLHIQPRVFIANGGHHLRQKVIRAAIGRTNADLPRQAARRAAQLVHRARHGQFGLRGMGHKALAIHR